MSARSLLEDSRQIVKAIRMIELGHGCRCCSRKPICLMSGC